MSSNFKMIKGVKVSGTIHNAVIADVKEAGTMPVKEALKKNVSVANERSNEYDGVKTSGIKIRGTGAATKGLMARGPMA